MSNKNIEKLQSLLKKLALKIYKEGLPGWIFSTVVFFVAVSGWILAGFGVKKFMELVTSKDNFIVTLYIIALGGTMSNRYIKKWMGIEDKDSGT